MTHQPLYTKLIIVTGSQLFLLLTYKAIHGLAPSYISEPFAISCKMKSSVAALFAVPSSRLITRCDRSIEINGMLHRLQSNFRHIYDFGAVIIKLALLGRGKHK